MNIRIKNPHSVLAAFQTRPQDILQIISPSGGFSGGGDAWEEVAKLAQKHRIPSQQAQRGPRERQDRDRGEEAGRTGAAEAVVKEREGISTEELFRVGRDQEGYGLWLALDSLQDPHNLGAIFRAAAFFGVRGILVTQERSAPMSGTVYDVSSGGVEHVPFTLQTNLQRGFEVAKEAGLWILGTSEHAEQDIRAIPRDRDWLLVLGNEEKGMRRLTTEACDMLCKLTPKGGVGSLNVSVAAGIFISSLV